jgi:hypothetical protein
VSLNLIDGLPVNGSRFDGAAIIDTTLRMIAAGKAELGLRVRRPGRRTGPVDDQHAA